MLFLQMYFSGANVLIFEGILAFHHQEVLDLLDLKVFVDTDPDIRLCRRYRFITCFSTRILRKEYDSSYYISGSREIFQTEEET